MIASHRKSTQVHARPGQTESQVDRPSFQLALIANPFDQGFKYCIIPTQGFNCPARIRLRKFVCKFASRGGNKKESVEGTFTKFQQINHLKQRVTHLGFKTEVIILFLNSSERTPKKFRPQRDLNPQQNCFSLTLQFKSTTSTYIAHRICFCCEDFVEICFLKKTSTVI